MRIKVNKHAIQAAIVFISSIVLTLPAMASGWQHDAKGRWFATNPDGSNWYANGWRWIDEENDGIVECYYFGTDGYTYADSCTPDGYDVNNKGAWTVDGIVQTKVMSENLNPRSGMWIGGSGSDSGRWQWLNPDGSVLKNGWYWLDGNGDGIAECYYFDADGWMQAGGMTSDGCNVDTNGAWIENGIVQTKSVGKTAGIGSRLFNSGISNSISGKTSSGGGNAGGGSSSGGASYSDNSSSKNYSDKSVSKAANDYNNGNRKMMDADEWQETKDAIQDFKDQYITDGMSDFEKEIKIIEWLVQNCSYEIGEDWSRSTAYSCIVLGKAQCAGYADAFLQTAKICGLDARYIYNSTHAWNLIKLDGDWYHVDVTWEDPVNQTKYGFGNLRNKYINLEDSQIKMETSHKSWKPSSAKATGIKYGQPVVKKYLEEGVIDTSSGESYKSQIDRKYNDIAQQEGSLVLYYTDISDTSEKIIQYLSSRIDEHQSDYNILLRFGNSFGVNVEGDYGKLRSTKNQITDTVKNRINERYSEILFKPVSVFLDICEGYDNEYYVETGKKNIYYKKQNEMSASANENDQQDDTAVELSKDENEIFNEDEN